MFKKIFNYIIHNKSKSSNALNIITNIQSNQENNLCEPAAISGNNIDTDEHIEQAYNYIPSSTEELSTRHYEVLKRLNNSKPKYAFTGIVNAYHSNLNALTEKFIELGLVRYCEFEHSISVLTIVQLKDLLRAKSLKLTGDKKDLIERIIPALSKEEKEKIHKDNFVYVLSEQGQDLLEEYKKNQNLKKKEMFINSIELINNRKFNEAYRLIATYNSEYNFIRGLNFNWKSEINRPLDNHILKALNWFVDMNLDISNVDIDVDDFKSIICYHELDGMSRQSLLTLIADCFGTTITEEFGTQIGYYYTMLCAEREAIQLEEMKIEYYQTFDSPDSCKKCKDISNKKLLLSKRKIGINFPPLCDKCRCAVAAYIKDW